MRVFVTGATGFIGAAIVKELIAAGHKVLGLTRSDEGAQTLIAAGAAVHRGDLEDLESLCNGAAATDAVIHTAFNHDFSKFKENCEQDGRVIEALGSVLERTNKHLVITSGIAVLRENRVVTEMDMPGFGPDAIPRVASEAAGIAVAAKGVRVSVVRLPPTVHGDGDHGFVPMLIGIAKEKGSSAYIEAGQNQWPAVHRLDAAALYRMILEKNDAGAVYHAVAEQGVPFRDIAAVIGKQLDLPVVALTTADAAAHFGWFAHFAGIHVPASSEHTRKQLSWQPGQPELMEDLEKGTYF